MPDVTATRTNGDALTVTRVRLRTGRRSYANPTNHRDIRDAPSSAHERSRRVATGAATGVATRAVTRRGFPTSAGLAAGLIAAILTCGCTGPREYVHNGFKVGPNYCHARSRGRRELDRRDRQARADRFRRPEPVVAGLQRPRAQRPSPRRLRTKPHAARSRISRAGSASPIGDHRRQPLPAAAIRVRKLHANYAQHRYGQQHFRVWASSRAYRDRNEISASGTTDSTSAGNSTSGAASAGPSSPNEANLGASVADYDDVLVTLLGDVATNYVQLRTAGAADRLRPLQRRAAASDADDRRSAVSGRHDERAGRAPVAQHSGPDRGRHPRAGDQPAPGGQPALHPDGHSAAGFAGPAGNGPHPDRARGRGRRHSGRFAAPPPRRPPRRAKGRRPVRPDRRGRSRFLSGHFHRRHDRLFREAIPQPVPTPPPSRGRSARRSNGRS